SRRGPGGRPRRAAAASTMATRQPPCTMPGQLCSSRGASSRPAPAPGRCRACSNARAIVSGATGLCGARATLDANHDGAGNHGGGHSTTWRKRAAIELRPAFRLEEHVIRDREFLLSGPFAQAALTSFFFMAGLNCFILLPLYVHRLGGTEGEI